MLIDLEKNKIPIEINEAKLYLRFNINAMRYLAHYYGDPEELMCKNDNLWTHDDIIHLLRSGLMDFYFDENSEAINQGAWDNIKPSISTFGKILDDNDIPEISLKLITALIESIQIPNEVNQEKHIKGASKKRNRLLAFALSVLRHNETPRK